MTAVCKPFFDHFNFLQYLTAQACPKFLITFTLLIYHDFCCRPSLALPETLCLFYWKDFFICLKLFLNLHQDGFIFKSIPMYTAAGLFFK